MEDVVKTYSEKEVEEISMIMFSKGAYLNGFNPNTGYNLHIFQELFNKLKKKI